MWLAAVATVLFAALTVAVLGHVAVIQGLDDHIHGWVVANRSAWSISLARVVTSGGTTAFALPTLLAVAAISLPRGRPARDRLSAGLLLAFIGIAGVCVRIGINVWAGRPRPPIQDWAGLAGGPAYPSGHTTTATLLAVLCAWVLTSRATPRRVRVILWTAAAGFALAVGWSRVWLGVHWPSDVAGALLYGIAWSATCLGVISRARSRRALRSDDPARKSVGSPGVRVVTRTGGGREHAPRWR